MKCPKCDSILKVVYTRRINRRCTRRVRQCVKCTYRVVTKETF
jgi:transcriptional regulator NrdR family protein